MNIRIQSASFNADQKLTDFIEKKIAKLENFFDRIVEVEVYLKLENQSTKIKDKQVSIKCHVPGSKLFAEENCKAFEEGVDLAVSNMTRQLKRYKEKLRG